MRDERDIRCGVNGSAELRKINLKIKRRNALYELYLYEKAEYENTKAACDSQKTSKVKINKY